MNKTEDNKENKEHDMAHILRYPGLVIGSSLTVALLIWGFWPQAQWVEVATVQRAPLTQTLEEDGQTRLMNRYIITAPIDGETCKMHLNVGDAIEQGQHLLTITPQHAPALDARHYAQAQAQVAAAQAALESAKTQVNIALANSNMAQVQRTRHRSLLQKGLIAQDTYDQSNTAALTATAHQRSAQFKVDVAHYELQAARATLKNINPKDHNSSDSTDSTDTTDLSAHFTITSPIKGKILNVERTCQNPINRGQTLLELGDPSALEVQIDVLSADAVQLKPGMSVRFNRWGGQQTLNGVIRLIEPSGFTKLSALGVEEQRVWVIAQITSPAQAWQNLGDGYRVEAQFTLWHQDDVLQIPASCLFREGRDGHNNQNWAVFILKNGRAQRQKVTIGRNNGLHAQVISGLNQNQILINHPSDQIENGVRVKARPQK